MKYERDLDGKNHFEWYDDDIPLKREVTGSCPHAALANVSAIIGSHKTSSEIAVEIGVPLGEAMNDEEFILAAAYVGFLNLGWKQTDLDQCALALEEGGEVIINYMEGNPCDPNDNHFAVLARVGKSAVVIRDTQVAGSLSIERRVDVEQRWHFVDDDEPDKAKLWNWALIGAKNTETLERVRTKLGLSPSLGIQVESQSPLSVEP